MNGPNQLSVAEQVLQEKPPESGGWKNILSNVVLFSTALLTALTINLFVFQSYEVDGQSMQPTLHHQDRLIIYKFGKTLSSIRRKTYIPQRGSIIVFHKPGSSEQLIKRVIGLPGERVVVKNEQVIVYNEEFPNGFNPDSANYGKELSPTFGNVDVTVGEDEVFVMGDNRIPGASLDSRSSLGNIPSEKIVGTLKLRYIPIGDYKVF